MMALEGIRIALSAIWENKLRSFLTLLGNIVGVMSVIAVVSLIGGIDTYVKEQVAEEGSNVITIQRINFLEAITDLESFLKAVARNKPLRLSDMEYLKENVPSASYIGATISKSSSVSFREKMANRINVKGYTEDYPMIENVPLYAGRHFSRTEVKQSSNVAVIGWDLYQYLFGAYEPLGKKIKIGNKHFRVIGVVKDLGTLFGSSRNRFVYIPITTFQKIFGSRRSVDIKIKAADMELLSQAVEEATMALRIRHHLRPLEENDFSISTSEQLIALWEKISSSIFKALTFLVSISLLVGGIVLMNIMPVSVTERTREIGIRKAIGARRSNIVWQFIVESTTLSVVGGIVGIVIGFTIAAVISMISPLPYLVAPWSIVAGLAVTFVIGVVFGTYPASKAARLDPVIALHYE